MRRIAAVGCMALALTQCERATEQAPKPAPPQPALIEYTHQRGPAIARGLYEAQSRLVIDTGTGRATLSMVRDEADREGQPIGDFEAVLPADTIRALGDAAAATQWTRLPAPQPLAGGLGMAVMQLRYRAGATAHEVVVTSMDPRLIAALPILPVMHQGLRPLFESPVRALAVELDPPVLGAFSLQLKNVGREPLCILDPKRLSGEHDAFVGVQVAALPVETPGVTPPPLEWQRIAVRRVEDAAGHIVLKPGEALPLQTVPWSASGYAFEGYARSGWWLVQALWLDYDMPDAIDGVPCVRGATFSKPVRVRL